MGRLKVPGFVRAALIRAAHTAGQTLVGTIGAATLLSDVNWGVVASATALAAIVSFVKSLVAGLPEVDELPEGSEG